jgi:hypothetical protein
MVRTGERPEAGVVPGGGRDAVRDNLLPVQRRLRRSQRQGPMSLPGGLRGRRKPRLRLRRRDLPLRLSPALDVVQREPTNRRFLRGQLRYVCLDSLLE